MFGNLCLCKFNARVNRVNYTVLQEADNQILCSCYRILVNIAVRMDEIVMFA